MQQPLLTSGLETRHRYREWYLAQAACKITTVRSIRKGGRKNRRLKWVVEGRFAQIWHSWESQGLDPWEQLPLWLVLWVSMAWERDGSSTCAGPLLLGKWAGCAGINTFGKTQGQGDTSPLQVLGRALWHSRELGFGSEKVTINTQNGLARPLGWAVKKISWEEWFC